MKTPEKQPLAKDAEKFIVRLPDGMRDRIAEAARVNKRSMNAEILARLQFSFEAHSGPPDMEKFVEDLATKLAAKLKEK